MAIAGRIVRVPDPTQKIPMIKLVRECIQTLNPESGGGVQYMGLKDAKELVESVCAGGCEFTFPNKASYDRLVAAGFTVENVTGLVDPKDEQTLMTVRALLQEAMDNDDIEAFEALEVAFKLYSRRVKGI